MNQKFDLKGLPVLNSMHDQRVQHIEWKKNELILHYENLQYNGANNFSKCNVIFYGVEEADIIAEVRKKTSTGRVESIRYYDAEFIEFINKYRYSIETINFFYGYETVIITASLVNENNTYGEDCVMKISATEIVYQWG